MELPQESQVILKKGPEVVDAVGHHWYSLDSKTEGEAAVALSVDSIALKDVGVDEAGAAQL